MNPFVRMLVLLVLTSRAGAGLAQPAGPHVLQSPDGRARCSVAVTAGKLYYHVTQGPATIIRHSPLVLHTNEFAPTDTLELFGVDTTRHDSWWTPPYGERSRYRDHYREMILSLRRKQKPGQYFQLAVRAYDEGVAFRYAFPENLSLQVLDILREESWFTFPAGTRAWFTPLAQGEYQLLPLKDWTATSERPLTLQLPNRKYAAVAEAGLVNYARMKLRLGAADAVVSELSGPVTESSPFATPWRVVLIADSPGKLLENNYLLLNLNEPAAPGPTDWIRPGKVIRAWRLSTEGARKYVDVAVTHNLQYIHFDAGWYGYEYEVASDATTASVDPRRNPKGDFDLHEAIRYAKSRGIGVWLYVNRRQLERNLDTLLPLYKSWGVDGIKFGFVHVGSHRWTVWLHEAVKKCAQHQLMVNIHDEYRPTGFSRTYPNLVTQEGVRGNEEMPDATHNTVLPFTRYLAGAGDYTVAYYQRRELKEASKYIKPTPAHQLALPVVFYSPLQWLFWYDLPEDFGDEPELAFWKHLPTAWDDTRVPAGEIGQYAALARRRGDDWYVGLITNNEAREVELPLSFLDKKKQYLAYVYTDGGAEIPTRTKIKAETRKVTHASKLSFSLKPQGGAALRIVAQSRRGKG